MGVYVDYKSSRVGVDQIWGKPLQTDSLGQKVLFIWRLSNIGATKMGLFTLNVKTVHHCVI